MSTRSLGWLALLACIISAFGLSYVRGGFADAPGVLLVFGLAGSLGFLCLAWIFRLETLATIEEVFAHLPHARMIRGCVAGALALSSVWWTDPVIVSALFSGWLVAIWLGIMLPLVVCLIAPRWSIAFGMLTAACITLSVLLKNAPFENPPRNSRYWSEVLDRRLTDYTVMWLFLVGLSMIVSVPIWLQRRRIRSMPVPLDEALPPDHS